MTIRTLFLLDGLGALLSAFLLGAVLPRFALALGVLAPTLRLLMGVALLLVVWSLGHACWAPRPARLRVTACANVAYCALTIALLSAQRGTLTAWGWAYFSAEMAVILSLAWVEWRRATPQART
jgi:hypothetical protein